MSNSKEDKIKEKLIQEIKANTPDLWCKIEAQLPSKKVEPLNKKRNKSKYIKTFSSIAAILTLVISISTYIHEKNNLIDMTLKNGNSPELETPSSSEDITSKKEPVNYLDLNLSKGLTPAEKNQITEEIYYSTLDIIPFSEELLKDMTWMGKVTILDAYYKDYKYDVFSDKFEPNGRLHHSLKTIVYEVRIDDIYLDDGNLQTGDTFKIEQQCFNGCYLTDSALFDLKINRQYILPLYYGGNTIIPEEYLEAHNYADGDITRDGQYSIIYSFAPQIEVTLDNEYIFHEGFESLINYSTVDVIMPTENQEETFYANKMKLRRDGDFIKDIEALIKLYKPS